MATLTFDPFRAQAQAVWRNRWQRWRRDRGQLLFHGAALAALCLLLGVPAWRARAAWGGQVASVLASWPIALGVGAAVVMTLAGAAGLAQVRARAANDWLSAAPVPVSVRRRRLRDAVLREAAGLALFGAVLLIAARASAATHGVFAAITALSMLLAWPASRLFAPRMRGAVGFGSPVADRGRGSFWRWQRIACGVALRGRTLAFGALAWLAVPMGSGPGVVFGVAIVGLSAAWLMGAWRRSVRVLPQAQAWLAPQPLRAWRLLRATMAIPAGVLALAMLAVGGMLAGFGAVPIGAFAALSLFVAGTLHFAVTATERARPSRIPLVFIVHTALLLGALQSFPIAVLPLWMVQMIFLLRRALR